MPKGLMDCPGCSAEISAGYHKCPKCQYQFRNKPSVIASYPSKESAPFMNSSNSSIGLATRLANEEMVREQSNTRSYNPDRESDHDKQVLQKAMLPEWFYLGRHQFIDHMGKPVGTATYNAYNPKYNNGTPISYAEFHMLVAAIVRIVDTGNPEGKRTKSKS